MVKPAAAAAVSARKLRRESERLRELSVCRRFFMAPPEARRMYRVGSAWLLTLGDGRASSDNPDTLNELAVRDVQDLIRFKRSSWCLQAADQQLSLVHHFFRQVVVQLDEQLFVVNHFMFPGVAVERLQFIEPLLRKIEAGPFHIAVIGNPADRGLAGFGAHP